MASTKQFYLKFNVKDFQTDQKVRNCSAGANGVYIHLLCVLFDSPERGKYLIRSGCLNEFAEILPRQNVQQNNQQIGRHIENICRCVAEHISKHLPFTTKEIETGLVELLENDVVYLEGNYLCQKRMIHDGKISLSRSKNGKLGADKTNKMRKEKENFAEILPRQNSRQISQQSIQQKDRQKSNSNYSYNYNSIDKDKGGIGNTEGVQGSESLGEEGEGGLPEQNDSDNFEIQESGVTREVFTEKMQQFATHQKNSGSDHQEALGSFQKTPESYEGHWTTECPTQFCLDFLLTHKAFKNDLQRFHEKIWKELSDLPDDELMDRIRQWGVVFNNLNDGKYPERAMRGHDSWVQHFFNWFSRQNLTENPTQRINNHKVAKTKAVGKLLPRDATIEEQEAHYRRKPRNS